MGMDYVIMTFLYGWVAEAGLSKYGCLALFGYFILSNKPNTKLM
jgi:hypothetical protein